MTGALVRSDINVTKALDNREAIANYENRK